MNIAIIPAKEGSKRIPLKTSRNLQVFLSNKGSIPK